MPGAVVAAALLTAAEVGAGLVLGTIAEGTLLSFAGKAFAKNVIVGLLSGAGKKQGASAPDVSSLARELKQTVRSATAVRRIVYGQASVPGALLYAGSTGTTNEYLHLFMAIHHGDVQSIDEVWLSDELATDARFSGYVRVNTGLGYSYQVADADLVSETSDWTAAHRARSVAYVYLRLLWSQEVWRSGIPNPRAVIKGRKVYDPRTGSTAWSQNPALCILDYLIGTVPIDGGTQAIGIGADYATEIDSSSFIASANVCDELVDTLEGTQQVRYTCDGAVDLSESPASVIERMLTCCAGVLVYSGGMYSLHVGAPTIAAETIDEDWLRGAVRYRPRGSASDSFNTVRGTFIDSLNRYEAADFPEQSNSVYIIEDGGERHYLDLQLPFTQNSVRAQRLARQYLNRSRVSGQLDLECNYRALTIRIWDTVYVSLAVLGFERVKFRVISWALSERGGIDLTLQREDDEAYDWGTDLETTPAEAPTPTLDAVIPSAPTSPSATGVNDAIELDWVVPTDLAIVATRVYRHTANVSSAATAIADVYVLPGTTAEYSDPVGDAVTRYYWFKSLDSAGRLSEFSTGVSATST